MVKATPKRSGRNGRTRGGQKGSAPLALPQQQNQQANTSARMRGSDRFLHIEDVSKLKGTSIAAETPFLPTSLPRLEKICEAFQRVTYHKLTFRISPQVPTTTSGGYVAAFIGDVSDKITNTPHGLAKVTSQRGSKTCKWWETTTVSYTPTKDLFYTSVSLQDMRLSSPGKFVLAVDGAATQIGGCTVYVDWDVTLSGPSLEEDEPDGAPPTLLRPLSFKAGSAGIFVYIKESKSFDADIRKALPDAKIDTIYKLSTFRFMDKNESNTATGIRGFIHIEVQSNWQAYPYDMTGRLSYNSYGDNQIAEAGELLDAVELKLPHFLKGSSFLCHIKPWTRLLALSRDRPLKSEPYWKDCQSNPVSRRSSWERLETLSKDALFEQDI